MRARAGSAASDDVEELVLYRVSELDELMRSIAVLGARRFEAVSEGARAAFCVVASTTSNSCKSRSLSCI